MNNTSPTENTSNQEIDLVYLFKKIRAFFQWIRFGIFEFFQFCINKIVYIVSLIILGGVLGFFMDKNLPKQYKHKAVVAANFGSAEYLYNFINKKELKISEISKVEITPVTDIFPLISDNEDHLKALTFLKESGFDYANYTKGSSNIFLYRYHLLTIYTDGKIEDYNIIDDFLKTINENPYFTNRQKIEVVNNKIKIEEYKKSIQNINSIFENTSKVNPLASVDITSYDQMNELTKTKSTLLNQLNSLEVELTEQTKTIFPTVVKTNIKDTVFGYMVKMPVLFLALFFLISWIVSWFKKTKRAYLSRL